MHIASSVIVSVVTVGVVCAIPQFTRRASVAVEVPSTQQVPVRSAKTIRGKVVWPDGSIVPGAQVRVVSYSSVVALSKSPVADLGLAESAYSTLSNEGGFFLFEGLAPGTYWMLASHYRPVLNEVGEKETNQRVMWSCVIERVEANGVPLSVVLHAGRSIRLQILEDDGQEAKESLHAEATLFLGHGPVISTVSISRNITSDGEGYVLSGIPRGLWALSVLRKNKGGRSRTQWCRVSDTDASLAVILPKSASIQGYLHDIDGMPMIGVQLTVFPSDAGSLELAHLLVNATTDSNGAWSVNVLAPGRLTVEAKDKSGTDLGRFYLYVTSGEKVTGIYVRL